MASILKIINARRYLHSAKATMFKQETALGVSMGWDLTMENVLMITVKNQKIISARSVKKDTNLMKMESVSTMTLIVWKVLTPDASSVRMDIM